MLLSLCPWWAPPHPALVLLQARVEWRRETTCSWTQETGKHEPLNLPTQVLLHNLLSLLYHKKFNLLRDHGLHNGAEDVVCVYEDNCLINISAVLRHLRLCHRLRRRSQPSHQMRPVCLPQARNLHRALQVQTRTKMTLTSNISYPFHKLCVFFSLRHKQLSAS